MSLMAGYKDYAAFVVKARRSLRAAGLHGALRQPFLLQGARGFLVGRSASPIGASGSYSQLGLEWPALALHRVSPIVSRVIGPATRSDQVP